MQIGLSTGILKYEPLPFVLKLASYLKMEWIELKTDYLYEDLDDAAALINSAPSYSTVQSFSVHSASKGINMVNITEDQIERHKRDLDFAQAIGSDRVIFHAGYSQGLDLKEELHQVTKVVKEYLDHTSGTDIMILLENTMLGRNKLCSDPKELANVLGVIHHERCGATLDIVNLLDVKEKKQKDRYKKIKKWVRHIQINSRPADEAGFKIKKYVKFFLKDLKMKKKLRKSTKFDPPIPVIIEGKTSLPREMCFTYELRRKLE